MKSSIILLIFVSIVSIVSINGHCIREDQREEQKSSVLHSFIGGIHCGLQVGARKTGDAIRNTFGFVKNKLTPSSREHEQNKNHEEDGRSNTDFVYDIDVRSSMNSVPESSPDITTEPFAIGERALFVAPCKGYTDSRGRCRQLL